MIITIIYTMSLINHEWHNNPESDIHDKINEVGLDIFKDDLSDDDIKNPEAQPIHCKQITV